MHTISYSHDIVPHNLLSTLRTAHMTEARVVRRDDLLRPLLHGARPSRHAPLLRHHTRPHTVLLLHGGATFKGETLPSTHFSIILFEILVLVGSAIPPAPASTRISDRLKHVEEHSALGNTLDHVIVIVLLSPDVPTLHRTTGMSRGRTTARAHRILALRRGAR